MSRQARMAFVVVVALKLAALGTIIGLRVHLLRTGAQVRLECIPIDPRSLLSGDYVTLRFRAATFDGVELQRLNVFRESFYDRDRVYVAVERPSGSAFHQAVALSHDLARLHAQWPLVLRGRVDPQGYGRVARDSISVRYGLEQYFVPQGQGLRIESRMLEASVEAAVATSGESALRRLLLGGREVEFR